MEKLIVERIKENKELFNEEELTFLRTNANLFIKVYLLGAIDNFLTTS